MKGKIGLFYFSGTGNTEIIAELLEKELAKAGYEVESKRIEDVLHGKATFHPEDFDLVGIGSPVVAFSAPRIVLKFMKALPEASGKKLFIFRTAGGVAPQNYHASASMIRIGRRKGYDVFYERLFSLGSNWVVRFDDEITRRLYQTDIHKVEIMCRELVEGRNRFLEAPFSAKALSASMTLVEKLIVPFVAKDYKVSKDCNLCGELVVLPGGEFMMGSPSNEQGRYEYRNSEIRGSKDGIYSFLYIFFRFKPRNHAVHNISGFPIEISCNRIRY